MKKIANCYWEGKLKQQGYKYIAGCDEVGCGALAGPIVAAAIILSPYFKLQVCDSKQLLKEKREELSKIIKKQNKFYSFGIASEKEIDCLGVIEGRKLALIRAIEKLPQKPDFILFDGKDIFKKFPLPYRFIIKGDEKVKSIACASILAKVKRDKMMEKLAQKYHHFYFEKNKGYGTKEHLIALKKYGPCEIHRKSYAPVKKSIRF